MADTLIRSSVSRLRMVKVSALFCISKNKKCADGVFAGNSSIGSGHLGLYRNCFMARQNEGWTSGFTT